MITVAIIIFIILALLSIFQIALIFGAPIGHFAWGGQHKVLPKNLRIGSAFSIPIYAIMVAFAASKTGIWILIDNEAIVNVGLWTITAYFVIGILMNGISRSKSERYTMTPICLILAICFYIIANG
jgi:hypothetical protein